MDTRPRRTFGFGRNRRSAGADEPLRFRRLRRRAWRVAAASYARITDIAIASGGGAWALRQEYTDEFGPVGAQALLRLSDALDVEQEIDVSTWGINDYAKLLSAPEGPRFVVTPHEENGHQLTWISSDSEGNRIQHVLLQVAPDYSLGRGNTVRSVRMSDGGWGAPVHASRRRRLDRCSATLHTPAARFRPVARPMPTAACCGTGEKTSGRARSIWMTPALRGGAHRPTEQQSSEVVLQKIDDRGRKPAATVLPDVGVCLTYSLRGPVQGNLLLHGYTSHTLISTNGTTTVEYPNQVNSPICQGTAQSWRAPRDF